MECIDNYFFCVMQEDIDTNPDIARDCELPGWYFQDETENVISHGPFATLEECREALFNYTKEL